MGEPPPIPRSTDDLTPAWFTAMFAVIGEPADVLAVEVEPLGGLSSITQRVRLEYAPGGGSGPPSVVVKLPMPSLAALAGGSAFERELRFYRELAPYAGVPVPRCWWSDIDDAGNAILILEDFPTHSATDRDLDATPPQTTAIIAALAHLHAAWWDNPVLHDYDFLRTFPNFIDRVEGQLPSAVPAFLERFATHIAGDERRLLEALPDSFRAAVEPLTDAPVTLVHHDLSLRNILLARDGDEPAVVFIDWQLLQRVPGVRDLSYFLGSSIPPATLATTELALAREYADQLAKHGIEYPPGRLEHDYRRSAICDFGRLVMSAGQPQISPGMHAIAVHQLERRTNSTRRLALLDLL